MIDMPPADSEINRDLARLVRAGDRDARREMILRNLGLVRHQAERYYRIYRKSMSYEDIYGYGIMGLIKAVDRYDPDRASFLTYSGYWIRESIVGAWRDVGSLVRIPKYIFDRTSLGLMEDREAEAIDRLRRVALFDPMGVAEEFPDRGETNPPDRPDIGALRAALARLFPCYRAILTLHYGLDGSDPRPLVEIAGEMGISPQACSKQHMAALRMLAKSGIADFVK